jgi:DHA2 family multidrug resistance protein
MQNGDAVINANLLEHRRYYIAVGVTLASMLELLDITIVNVAMPHMMQAFAVSYDEVAWISTAYIVANVVVMPASTWLAEVFGRKRYFLASLLVFIAASYGCGQSTGLWSMVAWRVVQGGAGGCILSLSQTIIYDCFPKEEVGKGLAIYGAGIMLGPILGVTLGGYITELYAWPWIFFINVPLGIATLLILAWMLPVGATGQGRRIDLAGFAGMVTGLASLQIVLEQGQRLQWWSSPTICILSAAALSGMVLFLSRSFGKDDSVVNLDVLKDGLYAKSLVFSIFLGAAHYSTVFIFPFYLQNLLGHSPVETGILMLPVAVASAVAMAISSTLTKDGKEVRAMAAIVTGGILFVYAMVLSSHLTLSSSSMEIMLPQALRGFGVGLIFVPLGILAARNLEPALVGHGAALLNLLRQFGGSAGVAVTATVFRQFTDQRFADLGARANYPLMRQEPANVVYLPFQLPSEVDAPALLLFRQMRRLASMQAIDAMFLLFGTGMAMGLFLIIGIPVLAVAGRRLRRAHANSGGY